MAKWLRKIAPSAARASMCGVFSSAWPAAPRHSPRHWSAVMKRKFSSVSEHQDVAAGQRHLHPLVVRRRRRVLV
ncbi:MAG TPA: hypothetical protein VHZ56_00200, partial [Devosia sp.]|nr:hypothetical protein [Devosia sp.]